jgi:hypothetical protein
MSAIQIFAFYGLPSILAIGGLVYAARAKRQIAKRREHAISQGPRAIGDVVKPQDRLYFIPPSATGRKPFPEDLSAIIGGALAAAFLAAALSNLVPDSYLSDGVITAIAAVAGGVGGKLFLV